MRKKLKIAMVGTKGIPAKWGGIEKYVEEVGKRLVQRGHEVEVFGSRWYCKDYTEKYYQGIEIIRVPNIQSQATDALSNVLLASIHIAFRHFDIVHFHNYASYVFAVPLKFLGKKTVLTTHGLVDSNWDNPKYSKFGLSVIKNAGAFGLKRADGVSTVAKYWKNKINELFGIDAAVLPAGIDKASPCNPDIITKKYGLKKGSYILFLGRIDPIKRVDWILRIRLVVPEIKIVIAGGAQDDMTQKYLDNLKAKAGPGIIFTGPVHGIEKRELLSNCKLFINPSSSEGLPISVLEAMSYERCCLASDIPAHNEIIINKKTGFLFNHDNLNEFDKILNETAMLSMEELDPIGRSARSSIINEYDWDNTGKLTEEFYLSVLRHQRG